LLAGLTLGAAGFLGLLAVQPGTSGVLLAVPFVAAGFGMAVTMPAATVTVVESAPAERAGLASGVLNAARQAGGAVGVALLGSLGGLHAAAVAAGAAFLLALPAAYCAAGAGRMPAAADEAA
jgi:DHA2 family methylenomycin A resistance protein-like MFS transporter